MSSKAEALEIMRETGRLQAKALADSVKAGGMTDTEIIDREIAVPDFDPMKDYTGCAVGTPVADGGQVYGLLQPYNAANYPQRPADLPALWGLKHTKNPERAKPYVTPLGTSGLYMAGECCIFDGKVYISAINNNSWTPTGYPQGWTEYGK